jgi:SAM-dependent methyltransferase
MEVIMKWGRNEIERLSPILEQISFDLAPMDSKQILVLCSATGELVFWLGEMMEQGKVTGVELDPESIDISRRATHEMGLESMVEFIPAEMKHIPVPDATYDALVREFIVYPTAAPTQVSQPEMARVLKPGGKMILTDVIVTRPLPPEVREALEVVGLDYLCEGTQADFRTWMSQAGLINVAVLDLTPTLRTVWDARREADRATSHDTGYSYLLDHPQFGLGRAIFYVYVRGEKPESGG